MKGSECTLATSNCAREEAVRKRCARCMDRQVNREDRRIR
jgi:hypothetical protein